MENKRINSKKRQAIYDYLRAVDEHPTAEMVYTRLKSEIPELSLGTVYRNLAVLEEDGIVIRVGTVDGQERYDARLDCHAHFVCDRCHRVTDVELSESEDKLISGLGGNMASSYTLTFHGVCGMCRQ